MAESARTELKTFHEFSSGEAIVGMVNYKDAIIIATARGVYRIRDGKLEELKFIAGAELTT